MKLPLFSNMLEGCSVLKILNIINIPFPNSICKISNFMISEMLIFVYLLPVCFCPGEDPIRGDFIRGEVFPRGYGLWVMGYGLWVMGYGLWVLWVYHLIYN